MDFYLDEHLDRGLSSTDKAVLSKPGRRTQLGRKDRRSVVTHGVRR
jgi:hypothetical protein